MTSPVAYLPRHVDCALATALRSSPVVLLDGPRGAGKTTTAARLAGTEVSLPRDLEALSVDPEAYLRGLRPPVLLDEWQLAGTDVLWAVKRIVDADPAPGRFVLTGSVEPATYGPTYPLTGRAARLVMRPMTWAELHGRGDRSTFLEDVLADRLPAFGPHASEPTGIEVLARPGFPAARALPDPSLFLDAYASLAAQRAGDEGRDANRLLRTMRALATLTGQALPDQRIWDAADINKATFKGYEDLLLRVHLAAPLPALESNRLKRLTSYPKRFLADTAMAIALARLTPADLRDDPTTAGRLLESFVLQQLRPQVDAVSGELMHVRTGSGEHEVDAVVEVASGMLGFEIKLGARPSRADVRQLEWLRDQLGDRFRMGFLVHTGTGCYSLAERVLAVPLGLVMG